MYTYIHQPSCVQTKILEELGQKGQEHWNEVKKKKAGDSKITFIDVAEKEMDEELPITISFQLVRWQWES